ncbi:MAG TPA: galactofuranosyltransferase [Ruminococcus sp.]|nr:galactofuranosyltransferase [Ruminococcus sp.]
MLYFTKEKVVSVYSQMNAGTKAREDINSILQNHGWKPIELVTTRDEEAESTMGKLQKVKEHKKIGDLMDEAFSPLKRGDTLLIQFPLLSHTIFGIFSFRKLKAKGVKIVLLVHDLEIIRIALGNASFFRKMRINIEEKTLLQACDNIIVHNKRMKKALASMGLDENKMIELEIFDYLIPDYDVQAKREKTAKDKPIIIAGNLRPNKAGYLYHLPTAPDYNLYGIGYEPEKPVPTVHYLGSFQPDELPAELEGSFGLIWDGETSETCSGVFGSYLKINNPHKTSLYLASGIPVVIWKKAALAEFIVKNGCGIVVESLKDIPDVISRLSEEDYRKMQSNTVKISKRLRDGYYTLEAMKRV